MFIIFLIFKALFETILQFAKAQDMLYMSLLELKAAERQHADAVAANTEQGRWGSVGAGPEAELRARRGALRPQFEAQVQRFAAEYERKFAELFRQVGRDRPRSAEIGRDRGRPGQMSPRFAGLAPPESRPRLPLFPP